MKRTISFLLFVCCIHFSNAQKLNNKQNKFVFKSLYRYAIQEDVKSIIEILDTLPNSRLTEGDLLSKEKYVKRFTTHKGIFNYNSTDLFLKDIIDIYRNYWTSILLKQKTIEIADKKLNQQVSTYLIKNHRKENNWNKAELKTDPLKYLSILLTGKGYFNNVEGKTGNLYDIFIWEKQNTTNFCVQLPDDHINVPVLFMDDIITLGWEEYATFGALYPGGWAGDGVLYCVAKAYDTKKENFLVSYLVHESQHFLDIKKYEEIPSWHLEYRAKLAEISYANETLIKLLTNFYQRAKNDNTLIHPYAEYCVIRNLSNVFFQEDFVSDIEKWKTIDVISINKASIELLRKNTLLLILKK